MREIIDNSYVNCLLFRHRDEVDNFIIEHEIEYVLCLDETQGPNYVCLLVKGSLMHELRFFVVVNSYGDGEEFTILHWKTQNLLVIETDGGLYIINSNLKVIYSCRTFGLWSMWLTRNDKLLVLDEIDLRLIDSDGTSILYESFPDRCDAWSLSGDILTIVTEMGEVKYNIE